MMDLTSAIEFFHRHGNVGTRPEDLMRIAPTIPQLKTAVEVALLNGRSVAETSEATTAVMAHFGMAESPWS